MNLKLLNDKIEEINIPATTIAERMGVSRRTLYLKLSGKRTFKVTEANKISEILNLSYHDKMKIFFEKEVNITVN